MRLRNRWVELEEYLPHTPLARSCTWIGGFVLCARVYELAYALAFMGVWVKDTHADGAAMGNRVPTLAEGVLGMAGVLARGRGGGL